MKEVLKSLDIKLPNYHKYKLKNDLTLLIIEDKRFPVITSMFVIKNGSISDSYNGKKLYGLSSLTSELLIKGTDDYTATDIANFVEYTGSYIISSSGYDFSFLTFHTLKKNFEKIFSLSSCLLRSSIFKEEEIEKLRTQKINLIKLNNESGEYLSRRIFAKKVYGESLYGVSTDGTINSLQKITRDDIIKFYNNFFHPNNLLIVLIGDIGRDKALSLTEKYFSDWIKKKVPDIKLFPQNNIKGVKINYKPRNGAVQSNINIGHKGVKKNCPDAVELKVMNTLLGGYFLSRINKNLREIQGCTYHSFSNFNSRKFQGDFCVEVSVDVSHTVLAIKEIIKELKNIKETYINEEELIYVKNYLIGNYPLQIETASEVATKVLNIELYNLDRDFYNKILTRIYRIRSEDIYEVANKYLDPDNLIISVVGPNQYKNDFLDELKEIGEVEIIKEVENF